MTGYYDYIQSINADGMFTQQITLDGASILSYATEADPNAGTLTWEKMTTYDAGIDMAWLNNRLSLTGDIYMRNTEGMLNTGTALPSVYGATDPKQNSANMSTKGWELSLAWRDQHNVLGKPLRYEISGGVGNYKTVITKYNNPEKLLTTYYEGQVLGELWGYEIDGLFANQQEVDDYLTRVNPVESEVYTDIVGVVDSKAPGLHPGDVRYVDLNGDGKITSGNGTVDNPGDRHIIGNTLPQYNYNFHVSAEWYGIDLSLYFQGIGRRDWYPMTEATTYWGPYSRPDQGFMPKDFMSNVWSEDNPCFFKGAAGEGIGGAHTAYNLIWPMSIMMKAFTADNDEEIAWCMRQLLTTDAGTGFMHESFHKDDAARYTRAWFAWQNTLFGELVIHLIENGKTNLLVHCLD